MTAARVLHHDGPYVQLGGFYLTVIAVGLLMTAASWQIAVLWLAVTAAQWRWRHRPIPAPPLEDRTP